MLKRFSSFGYDIFHEVKLSAKIGGKEKQKQNHLLLGYICQSLDEHSSDPLSKWQASTFQAPTSRRQR